MSIKIISGGMLSTVQDEGRTGFQSTGFSVSGVMDRDAYRDANYLVGNFNGEAVIEMTFTGICAEFLCDGVIALTGGDFSAKLNGALIPRYRCVKVRRGDILKMGAAVTKMRAYLAVRGGIDTEPFLGSRSTNLKIKAGGYEGRKLQPGDILPVGSGENCAPFKERELPEPVYSDEIRVIPGPQEGFFTKKGIETFYTSLYTVSAESDRMGCRLDGEAVENHGTDIISDGIAEGSIQVSSNGQPIIMLADRQTTGGYAKIATVITADIPKTAQKKPGDKIRFTAVGLETAQKEYRKTENRYRKLFLED